MSHENRLDDHFEWSGADVFSKEVNKDTFTQLLQERATTVLPAPKHASEEKHMYRFYVGKGNNR